LNLDLEIEDLISQNKSDFEVSTHIKKSIKSYNNTLENTFQKTQGKSFLIKHTKSIDTYIKTIFKYTLRKHFGDFLPLINTLPITLVSLGSYAREQLCVYSDIDLMIVYQDVEGYNLKPIIESILQISWDSGLKLGHRVHLIDDLFDASLEDQTIKTALLESRYICGSKYLWMSIELKLKKIAEDDKEKYTLAKIDERRFRLKKYPFNMQADIKSSAGGLRDLNTLVWIAKVIYNVDKVKDISQYLISDLEYTKLMHSIEFLFRVRIALHLSACKKQDKLLLQYIPDVATKLKLTQRKLVEKTFESMLNIEVICEYMIKKITSKILTKKIDFKNLRKNRISKNIYLIDNNICSPVNTKAKNLNYFLDTFLKMKDEKNFYNITYVYYLKYSKRGETDYKKIKEIFYKTYLYDFFIALYKAKKLNSIFPQMRKVMHLPQFDGYHTYPVDIHSIRVILSLENIYDENVKKIFDTFTKEEKALLRVTAFLHDCGKGRKKDHSELGSKIVKNFVKNLGFSDSFVQTSSLLIRYHTLMSHVANSEDIYSEKVIFQFIAKLKNVKNLEFLYVLTYADVNGVAKGRYSSFNQKLLNELFTLSCEAYDNTFMLSEATKRAKKEKIIKNTKEFKALNNILKKKILSIESNLLFFKYKPTEIIKIASWVHKLNRAYDFIIINELFLSIEIIRGKELNLGYLLGKLTNLTITSMDIFKFFGTIKYFRVEFSQAVEELDINLIENIIKESFDMEKKIKLAPAQIKKEDIEIDCHHSNSYATMSVHTKDQSALLANIMSTFDDIGIDIASAKIQTIKNRAKNLFLIEKNGKFCSNQDEIIKRLTKDN